MIELARAQAHSTADPDAFFARWTDHDTWADWDPDLEWVRVNGPVRTGTRGVIKPKGGPRTRFVVSTCVPGREYTDTSTLPGARLVFRHTATPVHGGTDLDVQVTLAGPLAWVWAWIMGSGFRKSVPAGLERLVTVVESGGEATVHAEAAAG